MCPTARKRSITWLRGFVCRRPRNGALLLVLDINMPRVDGVEVLSQIKAAAATPDPRDHVDDDRRSARSRTLLQARLQRVHHQAGRVHQAFVEAIKRLGLFLQVVQVPQEVQV